MTGDIRATQDVGGPHLDRRAVLRTAAHAAWAVPVISAVSAAPAFAAASDVLIFSVGPTATFYANKTLQLSVTVKNNSSTDTTSGLTVTVEFPTTYTSPDYQSGSVSPGWNPPTVTGRTFVFVASTQVAMGASSTLTFRVRTLNNAPATNSISVVATASDANGSAFIGASKTDVLAPAL